MPPKQTYENTFIKLISTTIIHGSHICSKLEVVAEIVDMSYSLVTALLLLLKLASSELITYQTFAPQKHISSCQTTYNICEDELVVIGVCLTRLSNDSEIAVYGPCPYVTGFTSTHKGLHKNYYHIKFSISTLTCLLYTSPSPRDATLSRMPSSA